MLGARVLAELGDDRARFPDARALKSYAGSAPITRASGKKRFVGRRFVKNNRLINAGFLWAFAALTASPGANAHYRRRREHGDWHAAAQRHLLNRFLGQLHHCLKTRQQFDEQHAFAPLLSPPTGWRPAKWCSRSSWRNPQVASRIAVAGGRVEAPEPGPAVIARRRAGARAGRLRSGGDGP